MKRVKNLQMLIADKGRDCFLSAILLLLSVVLASCEHRKLVDPSDRHYVRIYLDEHLRNVHYGFYDETKEKPKYKTPRVVRVTLSDPKTGRVVGQRYLHDSGSDERGGVGEGCSTRSRPEPPGGCRSRPRPSEASRAVPRNSARWISLGVPEPLPRSVGPGRRGSSGSGLGRGRLPGGGYTG